MTLFPDLKQAIGLQRLKRPVNPNPNVPQVWGLDYDPVDQLLTATVRSNVRIF